MDTLIPALAAPTDPDGAPEHSRQADAAPEQRDVVEDYIGYESVHPLTWVPPPAPGWDAAD